MKLSFRIAAVALAVAGIAATSASAAGVSKTDEAFSRQMQAHHSMAIQMAMMATEEGEHKAIRTTARNIVKRQRHEIDRLMAIAERWGIAPSATHGNTQTMEDLDTLGLTRKEAGMHRDMSGLHRAAPFDRKFIDMMVPHHEGAMRMARAELKRGKVGELRAIARSILRMQGEEIRQLNEWRKSLVQLAIHGPSTPSRQPAICPPKLPFVGSSRSSSRDCGFRPSGPDSLRVQLKGT